jgi:L-threonylcarbamoyladenylate synthase
MEQEIKKCLEILKKGGTILYPTDTIWGIGCDATNKSAVDKIYRIKKRPENKNLIILVDDEEMLKSYIKSIPDIAWDLISNMDRPLTIIYPDAQNLPENLIGKDDSIAIRLVRNDFCRNLIHEFRKPIVSSSANISGENSPLIFKDIPKEILDSVDYVVNLYQDQIQKLRPSTIIKLFENCEFQIIRS